MPVLAAVVAAPIRIRPVCINFVARVMLKINVFLLNFVLKILGSLIFFN